MMSYLDERKRFHFAEHMTWESHDFGNSDLRVLPFPAVPSGILDVCMTRDRMILLARRWCSSAVSFIAVRVGFSRPAHHEDLSKL